MKIKNECSAIIMRIENLTDELKKNPEDKRIINDLKMEEDNLCRIIKKNEKQIEELLKIYNETDEPEWKD